jgi:transcriptional regulator with XRE-family HTH domain
MSERESYLKYFGQNLRKIRQANSLTQEKLADLAKLDTKSIRLSQSLVRPQSPMRIHRIVKS